jgi:aminoglycoside phosphotransferase (APT) family kinase protein
MFTGQSIRVDLDAEGIAELCFDRRNEAVNKFDNQTIDELRSVVESLRATALGIPSEADYIAAYCDRTGRADIAHLDFYVAFNMFRLAAIFHGIKGRLARGTAASAQAREYAAGVEWMAEMGWAQVQRTGAAL